MRDLVKLIVIFMAMFVGFQSGVAYESNRAAIAQKIEPLQRAVEMMRWMQ